MKLCDGRADIGLTLVSPHGVWLCAAQRWQSYGLFDRHFITLSWDRGTRAVLGFIVRAYEVVRGEGRFQAELRSDPWAPRLAAMRLAALHTVP